jgi:hypothetical protein
MTRGKLVQLGRLAGRALQTRSAAAASLTRSIGLIRYRSTFYTVSRPSNAPFSTSSRLAAPLSAEVLQTAEPVELSTDEYHELADQYLDNLLTAFEKLQDETGECDVEYSVWTFWPIP